VERVTASGGEVGRINIAGGAGVCFFSLCFSVTKIVIHVISKSAEFTFSSATILQIGPLRCWPGGLCLSRSIGDLDVGEFIVPVPHVKQVKVSSPYEFVKAVQ
jgi:hypothetical protein